MGFTSHIKVEFQNCSNPVLQNNTVYILYTKSTTQVSSVYYMEKTKQT